MDDLYNHRTVPEYNTRAVVIRSGVPADTFRAWERRHGLPRPARTEGNHRLYSERDIAIISSLKRMTDEGVSISNAVSRIRRLLGLDQNPSKTQSTTSIASIEKVRDQFLAAFIDFDYQRAKVHFEDAMAAIGIESLCIDILQPVLVEIGDRWQRGEATVSMEHFGTAFCMRELSAFFSASQPDSGYPTIICACPEGEHHDVGVMMLATFLSRAGYRVIYLGANVPGADLVSAIQRVRPDAVALSSATDASYSSLLKVIDSVNGLDSHTRPIIGVGGAIFERNLVRWGELDALYLGADARIARRCLDDLLTSRPQSSTSTSNPQRST